MHVKNSLNIFLICCLLIGVSYGCTDIYEPELFIDKSYLVVEGLITDEPGPYKIKLTQTNVFGEEFERNYVRNADLRIVDSNNNIIYLKEKSDGNYHTPDDFTGKIEETYTLHIETADGEVYRSSPQKMQSPVNVDDVYAEFGTHSFFFESKVTNTLYQKEIEGVNLLMDVSRHDDQYPKFRFSSILFLQYFFEDDDHLPIGEIGEVDPDDEFCWIKRPLNDFLESDVASTSGTYDSKRNLIAFIPIESRSMRYLGFPLVEKTTTEGETTFATYTKPRIIKSVYALNDEAYNFHLERNKQLSGEGRFFDPISPQLTGNIYNADDPEEVVLGFFEVSSVVKATMLVEILELPHYQFKTIVVKFVDCLEHVSNYGCMVGEAPDWWL